MAADISKQCTLTNNCGRDVVIAIGVPVDETSANTNLQNTDGLLEVLTTIDGNTVIKKDSTATVTLDHSYKGDTTSSGYVPMYDLVVSDASWLYPIATIPVRQSTTNGVTGYPAQTLSDDCDAINQAAAFIQAIAAFPTSGLAQDYGAAMKEAQQAANDLADGTDGAADAIAAAIEEITNKFFQSTAEYKQVTLAATVALNNYYNAIPAIWAKYKDSAVYYLYCSDGTTGGFIGTLSLNKTGAIDLGKANGGYTCTFVPAKVKFDKAGIDVDSSKAIVLTYAKGLFTNDPSTGNPAIALQGSFTKASLFVGDDNNNNILILVNGITNGQYCVGFDTPQTSTSAALKVTAAAQSSDDLAHYWDVLTHPNTQLQWAISLCTLACAILIFPSFGAAVYGVYRVVKYKLAVKEALEKKIIEFTREEWDEFNSTSETLQIAAQMGDFFVVPNAKNVEGYERVAKNNYVASELVKALKKQRDGLRQLEEYSDDLNDNQKISLNQSLDNIRASIDTLNKTPRTELETVLPGQFDTYNQITYDVKLLGTSLSDKFSDDTKEFIKAQYDAADDIVKDAKTYSENDEVEIPDEIPEKYEPEEV